MSIYGNLIIVNEAIFEKKNKNRKELKSIEKDISDFIKSLNSSFFFAGKIDKDSFSKFITNKSDSFNIDITSNIVKPNIMKSTFNQDIASKSKELKQLEKELNDKYSNFDIKLSFGTVAIKVTCKENK